MRVVFRLLRRDAGIIVVLLVLTVAGCRLAQHSPTPPAAAAITAAAAATFGDHTGSLEIGGRTRTYLIHVPSKYNSLSPAPLLLALHGRLGDGKGMASLTHLSQVADQYGFVVVYPDGYQRGWADGRGATTADKADVDDVAFLSTLIATLSGTYALDSQRIYVTGISNGGFMAQRLGCDLSAKIAAIAVDAATFPVDLADRCAPSHPMPMLLFNGTADPLVPYGGGVVAGDRSEVFSAQQTAARWAALATCAPTPTSVTAPTLVNDGTSVSYLTYTGCANNAQVRFYTIDGGGHTWPGGVQYLPASVVGKTTHNLDASQTLWAFVSQFTLAN